MKAHRWIFWALFLLVWTLALLRPVPQPLLETTEQLVPGRRWYVAKAVHVTGYALLAILTAWLRAPRSVRPLLMFLVMAHATATELGQSQLTYREGTLIDVGIDNVGVLLGLLVSWKWWTED